MAKAIRRLAPTGGGRGTGTELFLKGLPTHGLMVEVVVKELPERPRPGEKVQLPNGEFVRVRHVGVPWLLPPKKVCNDPECHGMGT